MTHLEGKEAMVRHLRAKFQGIDPPRGSGSAASPAPGSKGEPPPEPARVRRLDFSRAPSHSRDQSVGQHLPPPAVSETPRWLVQLKKGIAQDTSSPPAPAKPGGEDTLRKEVAATSDPPQRNPAPQTWPLAKDKGPPAVPAKSAAVAASSDIVRSSPRTGHRALPRRKPLPHAKVLGARPGKPRRPPVVDLEKFCAAAHPRTSIWPAMEPPRRAHPSYPKPGCAASAPARFPQQDAPSVVGDEDEIYDDVEPVGFLRKSQDFLLPSMSRLPAHPHPRGGGGAGQASNRVAFLAAAQREAHVSQKMKPMTLKECKKEEKADREFQKKFKFEGSISVLTQMMVDPAATEKRGGGKNLPLRRGEILDVIQFTNQEQILCRNSQRRYGYVPRAVMLHLDTDIYDDVETYGSDLH
ncbi:PML-RARA-regulated adapter molecule 1 isoform X1 [Heliangelus exortis]